MRRDGGGGAAFRGVAARGRPAAAAGGAAAGGRGGRWAAFQMAAPSAHGECGEGGREGERPAGAVAAVGAYVCAAGVGGRCRSARPPCWWRERGEDAAGGLRPVPSAVLPTGRGRPCSGRACVEPDRTRRW